jgi:branched-chain amino acid transport system permease protein
MDLMLQLLANGVSNGSQYALLGIGFGLIFGTTGIVHFAYGPIGDGFCRCTRCPSLPGAL